MWIKPKILHAWTTTIYIKFESGFCSIIPVNELGDSDLRIRDSREVSGWYDVTGEGLKENIWTHFSVSYNAKKEQVAVYINGELIGLLSHVPTNRYVKWIILGGDVFQPSFIGNICEVVIFNEAKESHDMKELYLSYVEKDNFIGKVV